MSTTKLPFEIKSNFEIDKEKDAVTLFVNTTLFSKEDIEKVSNLFSDKATSKIDSISETDVTVTLSPKNKEDVESLARSFNEELIKMSSKESRGSTLIDKIKQEFQNSQ